MSYPRWRNVALFAVLVVVSLPVFANHSWGGYHWARTSNPFTLKVHDNVNSTWETYLAGAQSDWNKSTVLDLNVLWQSPVSSVKRCTSTSGQIEVCNSTYGQTGWLGIAGISASGTHITKGYTKLNDTYFNTSTYNSPAWRALVTCQEVGHDFGLAHQDENFNNANLGTCMDYTNNPSTNQHPNQHDYDEIVTIYSHLDSTTTISAIFDAMAQSATRPQTISEMMADAGQFGMPVEFDSEGRPIRFVMPTGVDENGEAMVDITDVFWAPIDPFDGEGREIPERSK